jgi:uncharacterized membrane protein
MCADALGETMTAGTEQGGIVGAAGYSLVARRNNSLTSTGRLAVFAFIFVVSIGIALAFAMLGAWLILPFAGLEMLVLYLAFRYIDRHAADYERLAIDGDRVEVEFFVAGRHRRHELNRCWAQVAVSDDGSRLALRSHGRELEIGRYLNDEQRLKLARELKRQLSGAR